MYWMQVCIACRHVFDVVCMEYVLDLGMYVVCIRCSYVLDVGVYWM